VYERKVAVMYCRATFKIFCEEAISRDFKRQAAKAQRNKVYPQVLFLRPRVLVAK